MIGATSGTNDPEPVKRKKRPLPYRVYSKVGNEKSYLAKSEAGEFSWVRGWRDAIAANSYTEAQDLLAQAKAAFPGRPACIVVYGDRFAWLPDAK